MSEDTPLDSKKSTCMYLSESLKFNNQGEFLARLREVVDANGGMTKLSEMTRLSRGTLYKTISKDGNPRIETIIRILDALGFGLLVGAQSNRPFEDGASPDS